MLPRQLQCLAEIAAAKKPLEMKDGTAAKPAQYVAARSIQVLFPKAVIESERDLDDYLAAVKAAYGAELKRNKRITL